MSSPDSSCDDGIGARAAELATALTAVRARIDDAAAAAGRRSSDITLVAVTKTYPAADARALADLGVGDLGENRVDELADKATGLDTVRWHFIGQLQSNKVHQLVAVPALAAVHSLDRPKLVRTLDRALTQAPRSAGAGDLDCFVQVDLDPDPKAGRGGARPAQVAALADDIAAVHGLRLAGLMAVAPIGADPRAAFARLRDLSSALGADHPDATAISAGMSGDLEAAVEHGATHVRVGAALLGARPRNR